MIFKKLTKVTKTGQVDNYLLEIPFSDLPDMAVAEIKDNYIDNPVIEIDIENEVILISEEISHGGAVED